MILQARSKILFANQSDDDCKWIIIVKNIPRNELFSLISLLLINYIITIELLADAGQVKYR